MCNLILFGYNLWKIGISLKDHVLFLIQTKYFFVIKFCKFAMPMRIFWDVHHMFSPIPQSEILNFHEFFNFLNTLTKKKQQCLILFGKKKIMKIWNSGLGIRETMCWTANSLCLLFSSSSKSFHFYFLMLSE